MQVVIVYFWNWNYHCKAFKKCILCCSSDDYSPKLRCQNSFWVPSFRCQGEIFTTAITISSQSSDLKKSQVHAKIRTSGLSWSQSATLTNMGQDNWDPVIAFLTWSSRTASDNHFQFRASLSHYHDQCMHTLCTHQSQCWHSWAYSRWSLARKKLPIWQDNFCSLTLLDVRTYADHSLTAVRSWTDAANPAYVAWDPRRQKWTKHSLPTLET